MLLSALFTALWSFFGPVKHIALLSLLSCLQCPCILNSVNKSLNELPWVPCLTGEGDVMVNELAPYNEQHCYRVVMEPLILQQHSHEVLKNEKKVSNLVHVSGDSAWSGKRSTGDGSARSRDPIGVIRRQEPCNANLTLSFSTR